MRKLTPILVAVLATAVPAVTASAVQAKPAKPRAELVTKNVSAAIVSGKVTAHATVKNKGNKTAGASQAAFYLSTDTRQSGDDTAIGTARVGKLKPKKSKPVSGTFVVPASVPAGAYYVVVCADSGRAVKERKEANNCKGSTGTVEVTATGPGTPGSVTVSATAGTGGTVAPSAITGGSCATNSCTFPSGTGTVTFTPSPDSGYRFGAWTGATCTGYTTGAGNKITFTNTGTSRACTATFVKQVTISWVLSPAIPQVPGVTATVTGVASNGSCTAPSTLTGAGSCLVDAGVGTVTLTAANGLIPIPSFSGWSGATCDGTADAPSKTMTFTAPASDKACTATFS
jgi:CARDB